MTLIRCDTHHYTYADYLKWPESQSGELIDGVAYVREPPAPSFWHQGVVAELCRQIGNALEDQPSPAVYASPHLTSAYPSPLRQTT